MPWPESRVDARMKFFSEYTSGRWTVHDLARRHGISRKTAYKFIQRVLKQGPDGLQDRSRARLTQPHRTPPAVQQSVVEAARRFPWWGPRKVLAVLRREHPEVSWPAKSTVGKILKDHGLVKERRARPRTRAFGCASLAPPTAPNDLWCTDFKGWCLSGNGERLEPFALGDAFSRYAIACRLVDSTDTAAVWPIFERSFREYGLPARVRSDNGAPFASLGLAGLTALTVRFVRLGIRIERSKPGRPQQNGMLERFNLTIQLETMSPPARTRGEQELVLERFRTSFNQVRPHEALGDKTPAEVYVASSRAYPGEIPAFEYPGHAVVRSVHRHGQVKWAGRDHFLGESLVGEKVGFVQISPTHWSIRLGPLEVGILNDEAHEVLRHQRLVWVDQAGGDPTSSLEHTSSPG